MTPVRKVMENSKDHVLRYLYEDKLLNAYAINRIQNGVQESSTYICPDRDGLKIDGYLSIFEMPDAIDIWVRAGSAQTLDELLNFLLTDIHAISSSKKV